MNTALALPGNPPCAYAKPITDTALHASRGAPVALHTEGDRTAVGPHSPRPGTFVAGRRRGEFSASSPVRTHARSRAAEPVNDFETVTIAIY